MLQQKPARPDGASPRAQEYRRRIAALGLDAEPQEGEPQDMDAFRRTLARRISVFLDRWRGCPQPACKRHRGCCAPRGTCANARPARPQTDRNRAAMQAALQRALQRRLAEVDHAAPSSPPPRKK